MATVRITFTVLDIDTVILSYDQVKIYRNDTETGTFTEITTASTRVTLVADTVTYEFIDPDAPVGTAWYKTAYFNSVTLAEDTQSAAFQGTDLCLYVSLEEIRDEGIDSTELSDERALFLLRGWQDWVDHRTGQFFCEKELTLDLDGDGSRVMWLPMPIVAVTSLYINDDFTNALDSSYYKVYNRSFPDDRKNPRIKLTRQTGDIFTTVRNRAFLVGDQNQRIVGTFGYVEDDGRAPFAIRRAITMLVAITAENMSDGDIDAMKGGRAIEEVTDRHRIRYSDLWDEISVWNPTGYTEIDQALAMYRTPAYVGMARSFNTPNCSY